MQQILTCLGDNVEYFYKAWNSIGVPSNPQPNNGRAVDAFYSTLSLTAWNQSRCSASTAYYRPTVGKRINLHLLTLHSVTKILINKDRKATGVQVGSQSLGGRRNCFVDGNYHSTCRGTAPTQYYPSKPGKRSLLQLEPFAALSSFSFLVLGQGNCCQA